MVIDRGDHLGLPQLPGGGVSQRYPADDVHAPQLHRTRPLEANVGVPGAFPRPRAQQPVPVQDPVDGALRGHGDSLARPRPRPARHLQPDPPRSPPGMLSTHLRDLHRLRHLTRTPMRTMRPIRTTRQLLHQISPDPAMQRRPVHPNVSGHLHHVRATQHRTNRVQALLDHRQDNQRQSRPL